MQFIDFIKSFEGADFSVPEDKQGLAADAMAAVLNADLSDPYKYVDTIRTQFKKMIDAGVTGKVGTYTMGEIYELLDSNKAHNKIFVESLPGYASFAKYQSRKQNAKTKLIAILSNPKLLNEAMHGRRSIDIPKDSAHVQGRDYIGYIYEKSFKVDTKFLLGNAERLAGLLAQSFDADDLQKYRYTRDNIVKGNGRELREALLLESAIFHLQAEYSSEDEADVTGLASLVAEGYITDSQQEQIVRAIREREAVITRDNVLRENLDELVSALRTGILINITSENLSHTLSSVLLVNQHLLDGQVIRGATIKYPYHYIMDNIESLRTLKPQPGTNEIIIPEPHPFRSVDLRGVAALRGKLPNDAAREYFDSLSWCQQIYFSGTVLNIEHDLFMRYQHKIQTIQNNLADHVGGTSEDDRHRIAELESELRSLTSRRDAVMSGVIQVLSAENMHQYLKSGMRDHYRRFMQKVTELELMPVNRIEEREYKDLAVNVVIHSANGLCQLRLKPVDEEAAMNALSEKCDEYMNRLQELASAEAQRIGDVDDLFKVDAEPEEYDIDDLTDEWLDDYGAALDDPFLNDEEPVATVLDLSREEDAFDRANVEVQHDDFLDAAGDEPEAVIIDLDAADQADNGEMVVRSVIPHHAGIHDALPVDVMRANLARITQALLVGDHIHALAEIYALSANIDKLKPWMKGKSSPADANQFLLDHYGVMPVDAKNVQLHGAILQDAIFTVLEHYARNNNREMITEMQQPHAATMAFAQLVNIDLTASDYDDRVVPPTAKLIQEYCEEKVNQEKLDMLDDACLEYMKHLGRQMYEGLRDGDFDLCKQLVVREGGKLKFKLPMLMDIVDVNDANIKNLRARDESFDMAIRKYQAVRDMRNTLVPVQPLKDRLHNFEAAFRGHRHLIEKRRDSGAVKFLKVLATVFTFGIAAAAGLWKVKGQEFTDDVSRKISGDSRPKSSKPK